MDPIVKRTGSREPILITEERRKLINEFLRRDITNPGGDEYLPPSYVGKTLRAGKPGSGKIWMEIHSGIQFGDKIRREFLDQQGRVTHTCRRMGRGFIDASGGYSYQAPSPSPDCREETFLGTLGPFHSRILLAALFGWDLLGKDYQPRKEELNKFDEIRKALEKTEPPLHFVPLSLGLEISLPKTPPENARKKPSESSEAPKNDPWESIPPEDRMVEPEESEPKEDISQPQSTQPCPRVPPAPPPAELPEYREIPTDDIRPWLKEES